MLEALKKPSENLETVVSSGNKIIEMSREALAKKIWIKIEELPDGEFFKVVDEQLDQLEGLDPKKKIIALKKTISDIRTQEAADKAKDLWEWVTSVVTKMAPEWIPTVINGITEQMKNNLGASGKEAMAAAWALVSATSIDWATGGIQKLTKAVDGISATFSWAMKSIKEAFSSIMSMLGLDKFWNSLKGLFGFASSTETKTEEKKEVTSNKTNENIPEKVITEGDKIANAVLNEQDRKDFLLKMSQWFWDKVSAKYFNWQKLSEDQLKKINDIFTNSLDTESFQKIAQRYKKDGISLNIGELIDAIWEVGWAFPAKLMWELSWSGIIPMWAITQHVVVNPSKNLIRLTFDGLGLPMSEISLSEWGLMLDEKAKNNDTHALDMARIQLYGVNGLLWRTMWSVLASASALGIMMTDTVSATNWLSMANMTAFKEYNGVASEFEKIEKTLAQGTPSANKESSGLFKQMMKWMEKVRSNSLLLDIVANNTINGSMDRNAIIDAISKNTELVWLDEKVTQLKKLTGPDDVSIFRDTLKDMVNGKSNTAGWGQSLSREWSKYAGGQNGAMISYLEKIDHIIDSQNNLIGNTWMLSEKYNRMKLAFQTLKMARSGDTVNLHLENADDISKFRSFLSVIPGGIKAISEFIPAASLVVSLGSIAFSEKDTKDSTGESLMDVFKMALIPAYGTFGIIRAKTVDFGKMIEKHEVPEFSDMAFTGVIGWVFIYEVTRVASGVMDMKHGNYMKGISKLTYMHDIGRGIWQMNRGFRNIAALATRPIATPELTKTLTKVAAKIPKKWKIGAWAALAILAVGGTYAYAAGDEEPEDILKNLHKEGLLDIKNNPTEKMRELFQEKDIANRKKILDELFIMHQNANEWLPKTHYDDKTGKYTLIIEWSRNFAELIDSPFRETIQSLGVDIDFEDVPA